MRRLEQLMEGECSSHILPFLWMHGEPKEIMKEEIEKIEACNIKEFCLESRPYPGFGGESWWSDVDFILKEAKKRGMRVWILDDDKFPTGHANGGFLKHPELAKVYVAERHMDITGPVKDGAVLVAPFLGSEGKILSIIACPKPDTETLAVSQDGMIDLTKDYYDGFVHFTLPAERYRLFILFTTQKGGGRPDYMNLIDSDSVRVLIDEVYESHYAHFKEEFGQTFAGFFSDEPELGNTSGYDFKEILGKRDVKLPWSRQLDEILQERWGRYYIYNLPALWYDCGEKTKIIRQDYMDAVTKLVASCFSKQLGDWCSAHKVEYIGHIIEDDNAHTRLGCSIGHYFREMSGQHMSGIDVVHHQIIPGFNEKIHQWIAGDGDGEFFHYGLAKLGSSCAHTDPKKQGRALCELFGNFGWAEGISFMKWLTDHLLVRGINEFVPHAFSPMFPDKDCPPHFYARGYNPQYRHFQVLMQYMNRVSHLLSEGVHIADALILYHAESEWSTGDTMLFQKPMRKLMEHQLDADIISADQFSDGSITIVEGRWCVNQETYGCLILPYCQYISDVVVTAVIKAAHDGAVIYMIDGLPEADTKLNRLSDEFQAAVRVIALSDLPNQIKTYQKTEIACKIQYDDLRFYCYKQQDAVIYMFFNESLSTTVETGVSIQSGIYQAVTEYDAVSEDRQNYKIDNNEIPLILEPGQSRIFILEEGVIDGREKPVCKRKIDMNIDWTVSLADAKSYPVFENKIEHLNGNKLPNMNGKGYFTDFSGTYRYEGIMTISKKSRETYLLYLPKVGDVAQVFINDVSAGMIINNFGRVDISTLIRSGNNKLVIEVTNTLVWVMRDGASTHMQVEATGLQAVPVLEIY